MEGKLEFYLNGKKQVVRRPDPSQTVLDYVRSIGLTGSKLGCQEGGCGACTMSLSEWDPLRKRPKYYAINGCIVPIIAVDGKHLVTVEGIGNVENPHAAQERIGKFHGSQCGFCTPGIVMSLYALLRETDGKPTKEQISEAFDGNLCRCTGYKPIIDAANTFAVDEKTGLCKAKKTSGGGCCKSNGETGGCCMDKKPATENGLSSMMLPSETNEGAAGAGSNGTEKGCTLKDTNGTDTNGTNGTDGANGCAKAGSGCCKDKPAETNGSADANGCAGANGCAKAGSGCCKDNADSQLADFTTPDGLKLKAYPHTELIFPPGLRKYELKPLKLESPDGLVWYRPTSLSQLLDIKKEHPNVKIISGASEVQIEVKIRGDEHPVSVFVNDIPELKTFEYVPGKGVIIGANIPLSDLEHHLEVLAKELGPAKSQVFNAVVEQLKYFAGRQIRNVASPAGNIATASPISDLNPIFVACNAILFIEGSADVTEIPMGDPDATFFVGYRKTLLPKDGILARILIPETTEGEIVRAYKQAKRKDDDISIVTACMRAKLSGTTIEQCSLSYGGVAPFTVLAKASKLAVGASLSDDKALGAVLDALDKEFQLPYSVPGGMAVFRRSLILSFFYKFWNSLCKAADLKPDEDTLAEVTRKHPIGVRELENKFEQKVLGRSEIHMSGMKQVTGEAQYIDDMPPFHKELFAQQVSSTKANAKIKSIDVSAALDLPGVEGYVDVKDVPGHNQWGIFPFGKDILYAEDNRVHYVGQTIGVICAETREIAAKAARLVKIEYEEFEPIITIEQAIEKESYFPIFPTVEKGDLKKAFEDAAYTFEGTCRMGAQEHFYLEPQGSIVVPEEDGEYKVYSSSQNPNESQQLVAHALDVPCAKVVARIKRMGGGFGGKETRACHFGAIAAVAARKFKKPVRLILTRAEDMQAAGQRHPFLCKWKVALDKNYKFMGIDANLYANAGYSMDLSKGVMDRAVLHVDNCYDFGAAFVKAWPCKTNIASNTAYRGFGGPQGMFCAESLIFEVSEKLGIQPDELRRINYYPEKNGITHYKQNMGDDFTAGIMAEQLMKQVKFDELRKEVDEFNAKSKWIKRGLAHVPTKFGVSFGVQFLNQAGALVHIYTDGSILLAHGGTEMGQGVHTKMAMICAQELDVPLDSVFISETATNTVANTSPSAASATSDLNGMAVKNACDQLNERLKPYREKMPGASMAKMADVAYHDRVNLSANGFYKTPDINYIFGDPNPGPAFFYYTQGSCISMVEVNTLTGDWANLRTDIKMDIGRTLNKAIDYGQIEGAFVQGQGLYTIEESLWLQSGAIFTRGPGAYKIPGFRDIPQHYNVDVLQDRDFKHLKTINRSKGIGEPPLFLGSTVMFAIRDALKSARHSRGLDMPPGIESPLTTERIRIAVGDHLADKAQVEVVGKSFVIRS